MRLSTEEIQHIKAVAQTLWGDELKIWLFGSRVDDTQKVGDIDLYIDISKKITPNSHSSRYIALLQQKIGEQKIDVLITDSTMHLQDIHLIAKQTGILL